LALSLCLALSSPPPDNGAEGEDVVKLAEDDTQTIEELGANDAEYTSRSRTEVFDHKAEAAALVVIFSDAEAKVTCKDKVGSKKWDKTMANWLSWGKLYANKSPSLILRMPSSPLGTAVRAIVLELDAPHLKPSKIHGGLRKGLNAVCFGLAKLVSLLPEAPASPVDNDVNMGEHQQRESSLNNQPVPATESSRKNQPAPATTSADCKAPCTECTTDGTVCTSCSGNSVLQGTQCVSKCKPDQYVTYSVESGFKCTGCDAECTWAGCTGDGPSKCSGGCTNIMSDGVCLAECPDGTVLDDSDGQCYTVEKSPTTIWLRVRCAFFDRDLHSRMPLSFTPFAPLEALAGV
jgi:hypothetical protein